ncbi:Processing alpha glucosidase I [Sorochytrium milnesiophthora]
MSAAATQRGTLLVAPATMAVLALAALMANGQSTPGTLAKQMHPSLRWGTYRPNLYFGTRSNAPEGLQTGLMWFGCNTAQPPQIRHSAEQSEELPHGFTRHDGRNYAYQEIRDAPNNILLSTEFIKHSYNDSMGTSDKWTVRIRGKTIDPSAPAYTALVYYAALEDQHPRIKVEQQPSDTGDAPPVTILRGKGGHAGDFVMSFHQGRQHPGKDNVYPPASPADINLPDWRTQTAYAGVRAAKGTTWKAKDYFTDALVRHAEPVLARYKGTEHTPHPVHLFTVGNTMPDSNGEEDEEDETGANLAFVQQIYVGEFSVDITYESKAVADVQDVHEQTTALASQYRAAFEERFEALFGLARKGFSADQTDMARYAFSNVLGSIGYFYGQALVDDTVIDEEQLFDELYYYDETEYDEEQWEEIQYRRRAQREEDKRLNTRSTPPMELLASVPARTFFPRGFFWDEGFHQLLIGPWDNDLSLDTIRSWFSLIDKDGWIAREQILGEEARSRVPADFQTQYPRYANPPTLLYAIQGYLDRLVKHRNELDTSADQAGARGAASVAGITTTSSPQYLANYRLHNETAAQTYLAELYEQLKQNYAWFKKSQSGILDDFGRNVDNSEGYRWRGRTVNHTFTSGLDDYPRANPPHVAELHVDLLSWMGFYARALYQIAVLLDKDEDAVGYKRNLEHVKRNLKDLHWNEDEQCYSDVTVNDRDRSVHVTHKGYITLFPLLVGLVDAKSPELGALLHLLRDEQQLWSPFGLRSLSKQDQFYGQGENYWKGPIWININYMALQSLHNNYASQPGPYQELAQQIYRELRQNLIDAIYQDYAQTGFLWEQYSPESGRGQRSHPFTGWTSLVVLMMAEIY